MFNLPIDYDSKKIAPSIAVGKALVFMKKLLYQEFNWSNVEVKDSWVNGYEITAEDIADTTMLFLIFGRKFLVINQYNLGIFKKKSFGILFVLADYYLYMGQRFFA